MERTRSTQRIKLSTLGICLIVIVAPACGSQPRPTKGPLDALGDSVKNSMTHVRCYDSNLLGSAVIQCVGNHADTVMSVVTTPDRMAVRVVMKTWRPANGNLASEVTRVSRGYSHDFGVGYPVCPVTNAYGRRWQTQDYFITVYPDPQRGQVVEKRQVGQPYEASSCPGNPE